jgi:hypothetical protein
MIACLDMIDLCTNLKTFISESAYAEMGSVSDVEHELQLVEEKIHDAQQVRFSY